jgi:hypothetical protein
VPVPHLPTPLEQLGSRPFAFYPAILHIQHNEWTFRRSGWDEILVVNTKSGEELAIPRRFLNGVSSIEEPFVIVGLVKELEYRDGVIVPAIRRVIEMPRAVNDSGLRPLAASPTRKPAPVVGIRVETPVEEQPRKSFFVRVAATILTCIVGIVLFRDGVPGTRARFFNGPSRLVLPFGRTDDYLSIVSRLGRPGSTRELPLVDSSTAFLLRYPDRGFTIVLDGGLDGQGRDAAHYAGAISRGGRILHSVKLANGHDSSEILLQIPGR